MVSDPQCPLDAAASRSSGCWRQSAVFLVGVLNTVSTGSVTAVTRGQVLSQHCYLYVQDLFLPELLRSLTCDLNFGMYINASTVFCLYLQRTCLKQEKACGVQ